jgi:glycosyltransferase involved in cell wall biosynthesis
MVSVIIATYNRCKMLARTLPPLLAQDFPSDEYEVIVVVDGSTDGTTDLLRGFTSHPNLRVIEQDNRGQAAAINTGLRAAEGEVVLFLDDDILCGPSVVAEHARALRNELTCLAFGPVLVAPEEGHPLAVDWARSFCDEFFEKHAVKESETGWSGCMASANSSAPRSVMLSVGGLDESFSRGNDVELGFRLLQAGFRFSYLPNAVTHQVFVKTPSEVIEDARGEGIAEIRLSRKFPALRATSRFGGLSSKPWWKRSVAHALSTAPVSAEPVLRPLAWGFSRLRNVPACRKVALRLFYAQQNIVGYRNAVKKAGSWRALQREFGARLPILMYHNIGPLRERFDRYLTISPEVFERQLKWLSHHGYTPIRTSDWIAYQREGKSLPDKPILLTFDDAYADIVEFGLPLLIKFGFTGTVFVVSDQIGGTNKWDLHLGLSEQPLMSESQIREWADKGIEFGAHTKTHADLTLLTPEQIAEEMQGSRQRLEDLLGVPVPSLAYPYGYYTPEVAEIARRYFDLALTCDRGLNYLGTDLIRLRRAEVVSIQTPGDMKSMTTFGFNVLCMGWYHAQKLVRSTGRLLLKALHL